MRAIHIRSRTIGPGHPVYVVAEMSANHGQDFARAKEILHAMKESGADAVKLQTYTPDTMTIECDRGEFRIESGTLWDGRTLYDLYAEAFTPWEWQPKLKALAEELDMDLFSSPFDASAVDFLEHMDVPAYKVASFEIVDLPLIRRVAQTGKPVILSTGMATLEEISDAVDAVRREGNDQVILLKCTSAYPAPPEEANLRTIPDLAERFGVPVGLSDHTLSTDVPIAAVTLGACVLEKHFCLSRKDPSPDSAFSLEPQEFAAMVAAVRHAERHPPALAELDERILGKASFGPSPHEERSLQFRRSLYVVEDIAAGEPFTARNVRSIRPSAGLPPKELSSVLGRRAKVRIERGTPLSQEIIE